MSKAVPSRVLLHHQRAFSTSLPVRRVVASNPVKAEEVKVYLPAPMSFFSTILMVFKSWSSGKYPLIEHEYDAIVV